MREVTHQIDANGLSHFVRDIGEENAPAAILLHGFPDSSAVWQKVTPLLVSAGFRVLAPDLRGFGRTDMPAKVADYDIATGALPDILALMDRLNISTAHIAGHDFGAPVAWMLAAQHPDKFKTLTALSVGHMRAFLSAGAEQKWRSLYMVYHQFRGLCEATYKFNDWALLRKHWSAHGHIDEAISLLSRPGRLTAGLNWYRANASIGRMLNPPKPDSRGEEIVRIPTIGIWSSGEKYLTETQMINSAKYVDAPWRYEKIENASHWIPYDAPDALAKIMVEHWRLHA
ncbi:alpha/beta fold hydrolase [Hyphococcus sp. DH-69]|uniref:alpha/beta fold hydrolase n=1 Tax=Hyphococcus formosus TaxID=3143534 RepID=UPI00398A731F